MKRLLMLGLCMAALARAQEPEPPAEPPPEARIPNRLGDALQALGDDAAMVVGFGDTFVRYYQRIKTAELTVDEAKLQKEQSETAIQLNQATQRNLGG